MAARKTPSGGSKSDKPWRDALMLAVHEPTGPDKAKKLRKIAEAVVEAAMAGDMQAAKEIGDRLDGKPVQGLEHSGKDGAPLNPVLNVTIGSAQYTSPSKAG